VYVLAFYNASGAFELRMIIFSCYSVSIFFSFMNSQFFVLLVLPILSLLDPTIVHGGERYSGHEQDLPPHVK